MSLESTPCFLFTFAGSLAEDDSEPTAALELVNSRKGNQYRITLMPHTAPPTSNPPWRIGVVDTTAVGSGIPP